MGPKSSTTTSGQRGSWWNGNEGVLPIPKSPGQEHHH